ncbi:MAG: depupylase/deamidase Dop [Propionibacteriaceae bacterium]
MTKTSPLYGTEQEYGIGVAGVTSDAAPHPMYSSNAIIRAWRDDVAADHVGFDYASEQVASDMWGFTAPREELDVSVLTDENPMANRMLTNGARFYVDHAHPEFSAPECRSLYDVVRYDRAGDIIMQRSAAIVKQTRGVDIRLYRNNTDGKGASYGSHENYLISRTIPFTQVVTGFTPHLVSRGIICGIGRVGLGQYSQEAGFQITQRADFFEREVGLETTLRRPIINTRDEPHADPSRYRRLHVITGDATTSQLATFLRIGTTAAIAATLSAGRLCDLTLANPVAALQQFSRDISLTQLVELVDGRRLTAINIQEALHDSAAAFLSDEPILGDETNVLLDEWSLVLDQLRKDRWAAADRVEWLAKLRLLETYRERGNLSWDSPKLAAIDLQWADIDPSRGLALTLEKTGKLRQLVTAESLEQAIFNPPVDTRAWLRGELLRKFGTDVMSLGWDTATVVTADGRMRTLRMSDPHAFTQAKLGATVAEATRVDDIVAALTS